jgi:peptidoglycan/LPS O-acetylase OafA/YrhL
VSQVTAESRATQAIPGTAPRKAAAHLYEIDVVRILTFACVIGVHVTSFTVASTDVPLYGLLALLHFTREVFFALSSFVLIYSYLRKPVPLRKFWPRRFLLVGVPYVVWSAIYFWSNYLHTQNGTVLAAFGRFAIDILTGTAWFHLYFLLVTMQVYLLVPVIVWLIRKTRKHHTLLLVISAVIQLILLSIYMYRPEWSPWRTYNGQFFFSYQFFIVLGAVAADHQKALLDWVRGHRRLIALITGFTALLTIGVFLLQYALLGYSYSKAATPLQPVEMVWSVVVGLGILAIGSVWAERRRPGGPLAKAVEFGSDRSFGIFLSHPMVLWLLLWVGNAWWTRTIPKPWLTLVTYVVVLLGATIIADLARRTPLSLPLTGRPFIHRKKSDLPRNAM